jgi:hypothetical protein
MVGELKASPKLPRTSVGFGMPTEHSLGNDPEIFQFF